MNDIFASWIVKRQVQLRELFVEKEFDSLSSDLEQNFFQFAGRTIRKLTVDSNCTSKRSDATVLNLCTIVTGLSVCNVKPLISEGVASVLLARSPKLRVLHLNGSDLLYRVAYLNNCSYLTDITIVKDVSATSLQLFLDLCPPKLQRLCLHQCDAFDAVSLANLQNVLHLRVLHIAFLHCNHLQSLSFPTVEELRMNLHHCSTDKMALIASAFPSLRVLILASCADQHTTESLLDLLALVPRLRFLSAYSTAIHPHPTSYVSKLVTRDIHTQYDLVALHINAICTDFDILQVLERCPALNQLGLSGLPLFGTALRTSSAIQRLCIYTSDNVTDANAFIVCGLQELGLSVCHHLTDKGMTVLAKNNPLLRVLELKNIGNGHANPEVTYKGLLAFLDNCPFLASVIYMVNTTHMHGGNSKASFKADACFKQLCKKGYPNVEQFVSNLI